MLHDFLLQHEKQILDLTEQKSLDLAGVRPSSVQLKQGLPIFYKQLINVLQLEQSSPSSKTASDAASKTDMAKAAQESDEPRMASATGRPDEAALAVSAGIHGVELLRLGYTLSHVVHAYGAMCQAITEVASNTNVTITASEFNDMNRCLDIAIAGAVTEFQSHQNSKDKSREVEQLGFLAHELRNALNTVNLSLQLIKGGTVGFGGSTGRVLDRGLKRFEDLIDRSLTEVRLRVDPKIHIESRLLLQIVDQIVQTAEITAREKNQIIEIKVDPTLMINADQHLFHAALSNIIQNALKYSRNNAKIEIRGSLIEGNIVVDVEDECGGLSSNKPEDLFKPFEQQNENKKGLGLGLTIAKRAIELNQGTIEAVNLPGKGCVFKIKMKIE